MDHLNLLNLFGSAKSRASGSAPVPAPFELGADRGPPDTPDVAAASAELALTS